MSILLPPQYAYAIASCLLAAILMGKLKDRLKRLLRINTKSRPEAGREPEREQKNEQDRELEQRNGELKQRNGELENRYEEIQQTNGALEQRKKELEATLAALSREAQTKEESLILAKEEYNRLEKRTDATLQQINDEKARLQKTLGAELESLRSKHAQTTSLLESRTTELKAAEVFLGKADKVSGADVTGLVAILNSDIFQTAARLAESFQFKERIAATGTWEQEVEDARRRLSEGKILGADLLEALPRAMNDEDPVICQLALQVSMCVSCEWLVASWSFGQSSDSDYLFGLVHQKLRMSEEQAISGRWRAMARKYAKAFSSSEDTLATYIHESFINILLVAGCTANSFQIKETIAANFSTDIAAVVQAAQRVKQAIGEEVTSCELQMIFVQAGEEYTSSTMTTDGSAEEGEAIIGTIELGLLRSEKQGSEIKEAILVQPKVLLQSELDASGLLLPPPSSYASGLPTPLSSNASDLTTPPSSDIPGPLMPPHLLDAPSSFTPPLTPPLSPSGPEPSYLPLAVTSNPKFS